VESVIIISEDYRESCSFGQSYVERIWLERKMSVENQAGDSPDDGITQQAGANIIVVAEERLSLNEETQESLKVEVIPCENEGDSDSDGVAETLNISPQEESPITVRTWFQSLSATERLDTLGFMDGPFLVALLDLASWSPSATTEPHEAHPRSFVGKYESYVNFTGIVTVSD
jgi:hypothetical protein